MYACGSGHGGQTRHRIFHLFACCEDDVGKFVDDEHYIRHEFVLVWIKASCDEFFVILLDVAHSGLLKKIKTLTHLYTQ